MTRKSWRFAGIYAFYISHLSSTYVFAAERYNLIFTDASYSSPNQ
jgi:hypothetical protein